MKTKCFNNIFLVLGMVITLNACIGAGDISQFKTPIEGYFPTLTGIDLLGQERIIPFDLTKDMHLVAVAFEREQQTDVDTWITAAEELVTKTPELSFYEIPLIYKIKTPGRFFINNGMRSGIPDLNARERTITVYTDREKFLQATGMKKDRIYMVLIDHDGKILWRTDGVYSESKFTDLSKTLERILSQQRLRTAGYTIGK